MPDRRDFLAWTGAAIGVGASTLLDGATARAADKAEPPPAAAPPTMNPPPPKIGSHLGNLYPLIKQLQAGPDYSLSFLRDEFTDVAAWKAKALARVKELLYYAPEPCEHRAEVVARLDRGDYIQETIHFNTTSVFRVPAAVLVPKSLKGKAPAIVALHDHGGFYIWGREKLLDNPDEHPTLSEFKLQSYAGKSIAVELVRQGYVVIVIDMFYWGDRRMVLDDDAADFRDRPRSITPERVLEFNRRSAANEQLLGRSLYAAGLTWPGIMFWDDVRTVDYLLTRPEVDPERIGCVGLSIGALRATHLAVLDPRIKASVSCGWMCSFPHQIYKHVRSTIGPTKLIPGLYREMDYPDLASLAVPCAQLYINGRRDGLFDGDGVQAAFDKLAAVYRKAGAAEKFQGSWYDTIHEFNAEMQQEAWAWLRKWLV